MRKLQLSATETAIVDDVDFELVSNYKWRYKQCKKVGYAVTQTRVNGKRKTICMHNLIIPTPKGMRVDHISRDSLDNRRANLRICTHAQNLHNVGMRKTNSTGFIGVRPYRGGWGFESVTNGNKMRKFGFDCPEAAARAYDAHVLALRGEFAVTNFAH